MFDFLGIKKPASTLRNFVFPQDVFYVVENTEWAIKHIGLDVTENLKKRGLKAAITLSHNGMRDSIVHYGSLHVFMPPNADKINIPHRSNKVVVTYFHVLPDDGRIKKFPSIFGFVDLWHTPNTITKEKLIHYGFSPEKIAVIPLGIDINRFKPLSAGEKNRLKQDLNIPEGRIIIGSFQKDGIGWEEGFKPKPEKGPDIFCDVVEQLAKAYPVFVFLIGPARGYIKERLLKAGIPYKYYPYIDYSQIHRYYCALDLYLITSRIEGGPRALLECMATSTPFVSTRVGMAADIVIDKEDGLVCDIDDVTGIVKKSSLLVEDKGLNERLRSNMRKTAEKYTWDKVIARYCNEIYDKLRTK